MIPKIIHYCWLSNDPVPKEMQIYMSTWKEKLSDYELIKWDFNRFPKGKFKWVDQAFNTKKYAFAADFIRLFALYEYGGIYLDMDVEVLKSYDDFLNLDSMVCFEDNGSTIEAATIGSCPKNKWIGKCLEHYRNKDFINADGSFEMTPIPQIMRYILCEYFNTQKVSSVSEAKLCNHDVIPIFSSAFFSPKSYATGEIYCTKDTYSIHQFSGTWLPWYVSFEKNICNFFYIRYRDILNRVFFSKTISK